MVPSLNHSVTLITLVIALNVIRQLLHLFLVDYHFMRSLQMLLNLADLFRFLVLNFLEDRNLVLLGSKLFLEALFKLNYLFSSSC